MSQSELHEHRGYLADRRRTSAYRDALEEIVRSSDTVLDLGAGTGLLGYLACEAGAKEVIAVDRGDILELAHQVATDNGYADRITQVRSLSTELQLDAPVDVVVCDQIGGMVHDAGVLGCFADARRRLLAPGGRLVPASFRIFLVPVTFDRGRDIVEFWSSRPGAVDLSAARSLAANTEWKLDVTADDLTALARPQELACFASDHDDPIGGEATFALDAPGRFDGYLGWFVAQMSPSVTMTNDPWSPDRIDRWCNFYPVDEAIEVRPGSTIVAGLDIRPRLGVVTWTAEVTSGHAPPVHRRGSTFNGSILSTATIRALPGTASIPRGDRLALLETVLANIDGNASQIDLVDAVASEVGRSFASRAHAERFVRDVVALLQP
ncbi:MAG: 50S ribosomal protein L11 methyltransferase [Acidimicrobiales bacterium]